jgi:hypothetical protein
MSRHELARRRLGACSLAFFAHPASAKELDMKTWKATFYVNGKRYETTIKAPTYSQAKDLIANQNPGANDIIATEIR